MLQLDFGLDVERKIDCQKTIESLLKHPSIERVRDELEQAISENDDARIAAGELHTSLWRQWNCVEIAHRKRKVDKRMKVILKMCSRLTSAVQGIEENPINKKIDLSKTLSEALDSLEKWYSISEDEKKEIKDLRSTLQDTLQGMKLTFNNIPTLSDEQKQVLISAAHKIYNLEKNNQPSLETDADNLFVYATASPIPVGWSDKKKLIEQMIVLADAIDKMKKKLLPQEEEVIVKTPQSVRDIARESGMAGPVQDKIESVFGEVFATKKHLKDLSNQYRLLSEKRAGLSEPLPTMVSSSTQSQQQIAKSYATILKENVDALERDMKARSSASGATVPKRPLRRPTTSLQQGLRSARIANPVAHSEVRPSYDEKGVMLSLPSMEVNDERNLPSLDALSLQPTASAPTNRFEVLKLSDIEEKSEESTHEEVHAITSTVVFSTIPKNRKKQLKREKVKEDIQAPKVIDLSKDEKMRKNFENAIKIGKGLEEKSQAKKGLNEKQIFLMFMTSEYLKGQLQVYTEKDVVLVGLSEEQRRDLPIINRENAKRVDDCKKYMVGLLQEVSGYGDNLISNRNSMTSLEERVSNYQSAVALVKEIYAPRDGKPAGFMAEVGDYVQQLSREITALEEECGFPGPRDELAQIDTPEKAAQHLNRNETVLLLYAIQRYFLIKQDLLEKENEAFCESCVFALSNVLKKIKDSAQLTEENLALFFEKFMPPYKNMQFHYRKAFWAAMKGKYPAVMGALLLQVEAGVSPDRESSELIEEVKSFIKTLRAQKEMTASMMVYILRFAKVLDHECINAGLPTKKIKDECKKKVSEILEGYRKIYGVKAMDVFLGKPKLSAAMIREVKEDWETLLALLEVVQRGEHHQLDEFMPDVKSHCKQLSNLFYAIEKECGIKYKADVPAETDLPAVHIEYLKKRGLVFHHLIRFELLEFSKEVITEMEKEGWEIGNVDSFCNQFQPAHYSGSAPSVSGCMERRPFSADPAADGAVGSLGFSLSNLLGILDDLVLKEPRADLVLKESLASSPLLSAYACMNASVEPEPEPAQEAEEKKAQKTGLRKEKRAMKR